MSKDKIYTVAYNLRYIERYFYSRKNNNLVVLHDFKSYPGMVVVHLIDINTGKDVDSFIFDDLDNDTYYKRKENFVYIKYILKTYFGGKKNEDVCY